LRHDGRELCVHIYPCAQDEPTAEDLAAVEEEMPLIMAEIRLLDAEIRLMAGDGDALGWHRVRQAESAVAREAKAYYGRHGAAALVIEVAA
jgi:hypothetical protein